MEKSILKSRKALGIGICVFFLLAMPGIILGYDAREYYPIGQGDRWVYSVTEDDAKIDNEEITINGTEVINGVNTVKMSSSEDNYICVAYSGNAISEYKEYDDGVYEIYSSPKILLPQLEIGGQASILTVSTVYDNNGNSTGEKKRSGTIDLTGQETVEVPAGSFEQCFNFFSINKWEETGGNYGSDEITMWLAPGVGIVKEFIVSTEYDAETKTENTAKELHELISAVVGGKEIGSQE